MTRDEHIAELQRLADEAREAGNYDAAVAATFAIGKVLGFYVDRFVITYNGAAPDSNIHALIRELPRRKAAEEWPGLSLVSS